MLTALKRVTNLKATIVRTSYGVPHITAPYYESLVFGFAYAFAGEDVCTVADSYVTAGRAFSTTWAAYVHRSATPIH